MAYATRTKVDASRTRLKIENLLRLTVTIARWHSPQGQFSLP
jgi:hypothetical protein